MRDRVTEIVPETTGLGSPAQKNGTTGKLQPSPEAIRALPTDFVKRHRILPLRIQDGTIHIATAEPCDPRLVDDILCSCVTFNTF